MKIRYNTKQQLVDALESTRPTAERLDIEAVKQHKAEEKQYLADFRTACRTAAKWSYDEAKEASFRIPMPDEWNRRRPTCPTPYVERLDKALHFLGLTHQQTFTFDDSNSYVIDRDIYTLLTLDAPTVKAVC